MMNKTALLLFTIISLLISSCNKTKEVKKVQVQTEVQKPIEDKKDSLVVIAEPEPEPEIIPEKENKYFLIMGCFEIKENAENFKASLMEKGFDSEIILKNTANSNELYKVSYKGFSDRDEAFKELELERQQPDKENVWLLIK